MPHLRRRRPAVVVVGLALLALASLATSAQATTSPEVFAELSAPEGITIGTDGNIFVTSDALFTTHLTKFSPSGQVLGQITIGGITVGEKGHLATDPVTGEIWDVTSSGTLMVIDPQTLAVQTLGDVNTVDVSQSTQSIYDVLHGWFSNQTGTVIPASSSFGDIALYRSSNNTRLDAFITARTNANTNYVLRLTWTTDQQSGDLISYQGAAAVLMSSAPSTWGVPRGIAVNSSGLVLTTLPRLGLMHEGFTDQVITFPYTFPGSGGPPTVELSNWDQSSHGIASDSQGWFYLTSQIGSSLCGRDAGASITVLSADRDFRACYPHSLLGSGGDVAVTPSGGNAYSTILNEGLVLEWGQLDGFSMIVPKAGSGKGTVTSTPAGIDCGSECIAVFDGGGVVTLSATPAPGSTFDGWSGGDCSGVTNCIVTMDAAKRVTANFRSFDAPRQATYAYASLVPESRQTISAAQCQARGGSTSTHGAPLAFTSCNPPSPALGTVARFGPQAGGTAIVSALPGDLSTPFNEADLALQASLIDIRSGSRNGPPYVPNASGPDVTLVFRVRISDTYSGPNLDLPATLPDTELTLPVNCSQTFDPNLGASCSASTAANALTPGLIGEGRRTLLQAFRVRVRDSGVDNVRGNADDRHFASQGLYLP